MYGGSELAPLSAEADRLAHRIVHCRSIATTKPSSDCSQDHAFPCGTYNSADVASLLANPQLGIGSIGTLVAHNLRRAVPSAEVNLLQRRAKALRKDKTQDENGKERKLTLEVQRHGQTTTSTGYVVDMINADWPSKEHFNSQLEEQGFAVSDGGPIDSLIVCTKAQGTSNVVGAVADRLRPSSVITLLQNGMGVYDELCAKYWPDPGLRPQFILGTTTHGVTPGGRFGSVLHMTKPGEGALKLGVVPDPRGKTSYDRWLWDSAANSIPSVGQPVAPKYPLPELKAEPNVRATLNAFLSMTELNPEILPMANLYHELLLKVAVNASINALTASLGGGFMRNGDLVRSSPGFQLIKQTVAESSAVLQAYLRNLAGGHPPEPEVMRLFSASSLEDRIKSIATQTQDNTSSMAMDVRMGRDTEIDYINGFFVALGTKLGVPTPLNRMLVQMVKLRSEMAGLGQSFLPPIVDVIKRREKSIKSKQERALEKRAVKLEEKRLRLERIEQRESEIDKKEKRRARKLAKRQSVREQEAARKLATAEMPPVIMKD